MATDLTAPLTLRTRGGSGATHAFRVANGVTIYNGSMVWHDSTNGVITSATPTSSDTSAKRYDFCGTATPPGNSVTGDSGGTVFCPVNCGGSVVEGIDVHTADTQATEGNPVYARSNNFGDPGGPSCATTSTSSRAIGYVLRWNSASDQDVKLFDSDVAKIVVTADHG